MPVPARHTVVKNNLPGDLLWSLCMALYYVFQFGYYFNRIDQEECLPLVYKLKNPALYPGDPYVAEASRGIGIRFYFVRLLDGLSDVMSVAHASFLLHLLCVGTCAFFIMRIAGLLFPDNLWGRLLAPFLVIGKYSFWVVGGNSLVDNQLVPQSVAVALGTAALYLFFRQRPYKAAVLCGIATLFQPLAGLQLMLVLGLAAVCAPGQRKIRLLLRSGCLYLLLAAPMLIPLLPHRQVPLSPSEQQRFIQVYFFFRNRHHYIPWAFPFSDWLHWGALLVLAGYLLIRFRHPQRKRLLLLGGLITGIMLLYALLLYAGLTQVCYTQWFKTSLWLECLAAVVIAGYVGKGLQLLCPWHRLHGWHYGVAMIMSLFFFLVVWGTWVTDVAGRRGWYELNDHPQSDLTLLHRWVQAHTPLQARILTVPRDESALCEMQRPLVFSYKAIIPEAWFMNRWYALYLKLYAPAALKPEQAHQLTAAAEKALYLQRPDSFYKTIAVFDYRVLYTEALTDTAGIVYRNDTYALRRCP